MYFQDPSRRASRPEWWTEWSRPAGESPSRAGRTSRLSGPASAERLAAERGETGQQVDLVQTSASDTPGRTRPGQRTRNGTRVPPSNMLYLPPRSGPAGRWPPRSLHRAVGVAVVDHRAVVAGEDHQRVVRQLESVERVEHLADAPVELCDRVAARAASARAGEPRVGHARDVDVVGGEVEEERPGRLFRSMNATASRVNTSAMSSSFHRAALPPVM